jgi:hypothetical protein
MFGANLLGLPLTLVNVIILALLVIVILGFVWRYLPSSSSKLPSRTTLGRFLRIVIILATSIVLINDSYRIVGEWDALTLYDFRALRIVETGSITQAASIQGSYFYSYPLYTSLAHAFMYLLGFTSPMLVYALIFIAFLAVFYHLLRDEVGDQLALLGTTLLIFAPHLFWHAQIAYTNLAYTAYLSLGALFLIRWSRTRSIVDVLLGATLTGMSIWVRSAEPFWLANIILLIGIGIVRVRPLQALAGLAIFYPLQQIWRQYVAISFRSLGSTIGQIQGSIAYVTSGVTSPSNLSLIVETVNFFVSNVVRPYLPVLVFFTVGILLQLRAKSYNLFLPALIVLDLLIAFVGTYVFAVTQPYWREIPGSLERMMIFISPLIIFYFIQSFYQNDHDK